MAVVSQGFEDVEGIGDLNDVDTAARADDTILVYKTASGNYEHEAKPAGGGSLAATTIAAGVASAAGNNLAGAKGSSVNISWDLATNDSSEITGFTNGDTDIQITNAGQLLLHSSVGAIDNGINNRTTLIMSVAHLSSVDALLYRYFVDDTYIRDDNNTYDSGMMAAQMALFVAAGDKLQIRSEVIDTQTSSGTMNASTTYSQIRIQRIA